MTSCSESKPSGILVVNKPLGKTSHDVVEQIRALTSVRRVGHAGTLDPLATGVLVICVGRKATRVSEYLMDEPKTYRTDVQLGVVTDTFDGEGEIVSRSAVDVDHDEVERALATFRGSIEQIPPMYSAVKHHGKPLYRLARKGIEVKREPRRVEIHRLELVAWEPHQAQCTLEMVCSPGTYVRVLVHDLGQELGCGAYVTGLTRLASGSFRLEEALTPDRFGQAVESGCWSALLHPVDEALADQFPALALDATHAKQLCSGQSIPRNVSLPQNTTLARAYGPEGRFLGLARYDSDRNVWRPKKIFISPYPERHTQSSD